MSSDWQIDCGPDGTILFGSQSSRYPFSEAPEIGDPARANQDGTIPGSDGSFFGVDTLAGQTIAFGLNAVGDTDAEAEALYAAFRRAWRADSIRSDSGTTATLTAPSGRSTFGRPRRITPTYHPHDAGVVGITADFSTVDDLWYSEERAAVATLGYRAAGGIKFPVKFPITTSPESDRSQAFVVAGDVATWGVYEITGPVLSPWLEIPGLARYSFTGLRLAYDQWLTIDTRPWAREVYRSDGAPLGGTLDASSTLLSSAPLTPGRHELLLRGTTTGTPRATATWRDAFTTP